MGLEFKGAEISVFFTNGGGEDLYAAWTTLAARQPESPARERLLAYLDRHHLFSLDFTAPEWMDLDEDARRLFGTVVGQAIAEVAKLQPEEGLFPVVVWSDELRMKWLARLIEIFAMVSSSPLPAAVIDACEWERLVLHLEESHRRGKPDLALLDRMLTLTREGRGNPRRVAHEAQGAALVLALDGRKSDARALLDRTLSLDLSPEDRAAAQQTLSDLDSLG